MKKFFCCLFFFHLFFCCTGYGQTAGCTDPLATNFNAAADSNDGSCVYATASVAPDTSFILSSNLSETSGLVFWNHYLWTHNDNTDLNLYSLDTASGAIVQPFALNGVANIDWEEISQDDNYIYVGDFGNNANGNRTDLKILRIEKNSLLLNAPAIDTINFSYSDQTTFTPTGACNTDFDCEAFVVASDSIFLFTKQWLSKQTSLYALPKTPGTFTATLKSTFNADGLITGATYLQDKKLLVLCGYSSTLAPFTWLFYDFKGYDFFGGNKRKISLALPIHQIEGIATSNGLLYYFSNEYFARYKVFTCEQKLHVVDMSLFLSNYLLGTPAGISETEVITDHNNITIYPNPGKNIITVKLHRTNTAKNYFISEMTGKIVQSGNLPGDSNIIKVNKLKKGTYLLKIGNDNVFKWVKE
ncbi:MAG TPA: T9SS type A sorting domain-containing protein [Bacteroidales bacterium]|nr:T9SS type A sorting domain-containing protein [Bacteroidales bacterium]HPB24477.1 T9SS type A sorting domain-containing protein [Bacteroidales bacterium]HPI29256.1 T9SS type A sorting domain-containing protein [Bacteroidales bacterium]